MLAARRKTDKDKKAAGRNVYPWSKWFSKERFTLARGKHFRCSVSSMVQQVRNRASSLGLHISLEEGAGRIAVQVLAPYRRVVQEELF